MRRLAFALLLLSTPVLAQDRRDAKDQDLKKASSASPDKSLAGDLTRKKEEGDKKAPALQYDQFRLGVELQVASKRRSLIEQLEKIIQLSPQKSEAPKLHFQLAELYVEESKFFFFEANRQDDELIKAMNAKDAAGQQRAKAEKARFLVESKKYSDRAQAEYKKIVVGYRDFARMDEVLFFLGTAMMDQNREKDALTVLGRLVAKHPKSKFVPDAHFAFGEYYFNNSKGRHDWLQKGLTAYKKAAEFPESQVYAFAIYKQGWCHFNMGDFQGAMDKFKAVVLFGELAGEKGVEKDGAKGGKGGLIREARNDYVRAYSRVGNAAGAKAAFKFTGDADVQFTMIKQLANLFYEDGKDRDAAVAYNMLIQQKPLSPEAPGFQGKIVDCVMRAGNKGMTVQQVRRLVKIMQDVESSGVIKEDKDKRALEDAKELSERTLSNLAVTWHNEAKKTRDDETFDFSNQVYADYLTLFPDNPKAYDLRFFWSELLNDNLLKFEKAAGQYTIVARQDIGKLENGEPDAKTGKVKKPGKPGKWFTNALYNAILAYDEVLKKEDEAKEAKESKDPKKTAAVDFTKKQEINGTKLALLEACDRYIKYQPKGEKRVEIMFKAAQLFYRHNHFDEAVLRFSEITQGYPEYKFEDGTRAAEISANLVLDSFNALGNWEKVNEWARRFYKNEKLATGKFREELSKLIEESSFKLVNQMEAKKEFAKAAEAYLNFVSEFPRSAIADKALYNASIDFHNAKMRDRAVQVRNRIIKDYPRSEFVPRCIYANAETHEAIGDFTEAAEQYERYLVGYERSLNQKERERELRKRGKKRPEPKDAPKPVEQKYEEDKAQIALFNAGVFREYLGQFKQALKNRERYLTLWPAEGKGMKDGEAMFLSIADLYEKMGLYNKALTHLEEYERKWMRDPSKVLGAEGRIVKIFEEKLRRPRDVNRLNGRILKYYDDLGPKARRSLDPRAVEAVAKAHYLKNEEEYRFYATYKLRWGGAPDPTREFTAALQEKAKRLKRVQEIYTETIGLKAGDPAICGLYKIGLAYANFAEVLMNAPMPRGVDQEFQDALRDQLNAQADAPKAKAAEAFGAAVQKSRELDIYNDCAKRALAQLRETYQPDRFPEMHEATVELASVHDPILGGEILSAIQEVPVLTAEQTELAKERSLEIREQTQDLASRPDPGPEVRDQRDEEPSEPPPPSGGPQADESEPEDEL
ncbi:MAG: tetratricopeptide repeat protein [Myxococcota bacterium]|nr:tetratricopeptide repeat protein [Myxococcota bacterium]